MSASQPRLLETYNSLTDKHLVGYFSNARIRRHLQKSGLISRSGRIIPEKEYRLNAMRREHQRSVRDCLADAIFHKVLDMEHHHHQMKKKKDLECSGSKERMQPVKVEEIIGSVEEVIHVHGPHPPLTPRSCHELCPLVAEERPGCSRWRAARLGVDCGGGCYCCCCPHQHRTKEPAPSKVSSLRPNTAPGNMQQLPYLQPLHGWAAAGSVPKAPRQKCHALEHDQHAHDQQFARGRKRRDLRLLSSVEYVTAVSPYQVPIAHRCVVPMPPSCLLRGDRRLCAVRRGLPVERWFHPTTAFNEQLLIRNNKGFPKSPLCSNAFVTMAYLGKSKHVSLREYKDEIKVYQQYCGTENICVYKGELLEGDTFQFTSKRYLGFPFSLTFYLNGMQVERLSCCCEYRGVQDKRRSQLRRRNSYFRVLHAAGAPPCYKCLVAMGLDKKLCPPKRKARRYHVCYWGHALPCASSIEQKSKEDSESVTEPGHEASMETIDETLETGEESSKEEMETQSSQEDTSKDEYDEDFEAYEEVNEEGQTGDQINGMSESSSDDKNHNLDYGKESETSSQKALQASDSEKDESDGYSGDRDSEDDLQVRRPADSLSSMSPQCSTETDSRAETMTDNMNGKEDCNVKSAFDSAAHAHCGNENGEKKLLRMEENQETSALEKKGIDEVEKTKPEDLTGMEDTRIFHENIMAMQHQNAEDNWEFKQTGSGESNMNEEKCPPVPWEGRVLDMEDGREESPCCEEGGVFEDCKPVQEETAKATGNDHPVHSAPGPGDLCANEEEKNAANTECDISGAPDGSFLAEERRSLDVQDAAGQAAGEGRVTGRGRALEPGGAAEGGAGRREPGGKAARAGDSLPQAGTGAALEEPAPEEGAEAEGHPKGKGTGEAVKLGTELSAGEQEVLVEGMEREVALGKPAAGGEGPAGALPGWEADTAVPRGQEGAAGVAEEEAAEEGLKGAVGLPAEQEVGEAGESLGQGGSARKDTVVCAVSQGGEAVEDADVAAGGIARAVSPEGEEAVEEEISDREEAMGKPGALGDALGDVETGEAMPGGEGKGKGKVRVKPSEFSQLKVSGAEWVEIGKAVTGATALESAQAGEVGGNALQRVGDTMEKSAEPDKGSVLEVAPGLGALGGAQGDPGIEGLSQVKEGTAGALQSGNPSEGSKAETEKAGEGKPKGEVAGAGSGGEEEATDRTAGSEELEVGTEGWLRCGKVRGEGRSPGKGVVVEAALPPLGFCGTQAGESGLVAIAVVGGQAGQGALAGRAGTGVMAREGVTGAVLVAQSGTEAAVAEEVSAKGTAAVGQSGRDGEGVAGGPVAGGRPGGPGGSSRV